MVDAWGLEPEDDMFHPPPDGEPWWTETTWFSWMVPERGLMGHWYLVLDWARRAQVLRPAMGSLADRRHSPLPA